MGIFSQIKKRFAGTDEVKDASKPKVNAKASKTETSAKVAKPKADKKASKKSEAAKQVVMGNSAHIVKFPDVTEKSAMMQEQGKYVFIVSDEATKPKVARAIKSMYGVDVVSVRMLNRKGKHVAAGRVYGKRSDIKKAIVRVAAGQTISIFDAEEK